MDLGVKLSSNWAPELSASVLSVSALGALVGVLAYANGAVVHSWHGITLNAVVSALATISKLAATFVVASAISQAKWCLFSEGPRPLKEFEEIDLASRGAVGCVRYLYKIRKLTFFGAYAVILSVIFDPFSQQLVHYQSDVLYNPSNTTTVPRATRYSGGDRIVVTATDLGGGPGVYANADYSMQSALTSALVQPMSEIVQQLKLTCRSGNCTWPSFESLAICSSCNDVKSYLIIANGTEQLSDNLSLGNPGTSYDPSGIPRPTLPNGLSIDGSVQMTTYGTGNPANTVTMKSIDTLIWSMTVLKEQQAATKRSAAQYEALECALRYCVRQYKSAVIDNQLDESSSLVEDATRNQESWQIHDPDFQFYRSKQNDTITKADQYSIDFNTSAVGLIRWDLMLGNGYNVSQAAVNGISSLFYTTFTYGIYDFGNSQPSYPGINGFYIDGGAKYTQYDPPAINQLWISPNIEETFEILAVSMRNAIRAGSDNKETQPGQQGTSVIKFQIEWPWITLPILVVLTSLAQLLVIIQASRTVPLWKASTLAVLSRGRFLDHLLDRASTLHEMREAAAGGTNVNLFEDGAELKSLNSGSGYSMLLQR